MEEILHLWVALKYSTLTKTSGGLHGMQFSQMLEMIIMVLSSRSCDIRKNSKQGIRSYQMGKE